MVAWLEAGHMEGERVGSFAHASGVFQAIELGMDASAVKATEAG